MFNVQPAFLAFLGTGSPPNEDEDSLWDQTVLLLRGDSAVDSSQSTKTVNLAGVGVNTPLISDVQSKFGRALYTTGAGNSSFTIPYSTDFNFTTGQDFTMECWIYFNAMSNTYRHVFGLGNGNQPGNPGSYSLASFNSRLWFNALVGSTILTANRWYHVAVVREGATVRMFLDGVQDASGTNATSFTYASGPFTIGDRTAGNPQANYPTNAYYDEFRVTRAARYTAAGFTPPTAPFPSEPVDTIYGRWDTLRKHVAIGFVDGTDNRGLIKTSGSTWVSALGDSRTIVTSGKWYYEVTIVSGATATIIIGFGNTATATGNFVGATTDSTGYYTNGTFSNPPPGGSPGITYTLGDTIGVALDVDGKNVSYYKKSGETMTLIGTRNWSTVVTGTNFQPAISIYSPSSSILANFGNAPFTAVPDGYNAGFYAPGSV